MRVYAIAPHTVGCWTIFPENCKVKLLQVVGMCWVATAGCCWTDGGLPQAEALPTVGTGRHPSAPACMQEGARARWAVEVNVAGIWMMRVRAVVAAVRYANNSKDSMGGRETVETNSSSKQSSNGITTVTTRARIRDRAEQTRCCDRLMALALAALAPPARSTMRPIQSNAIAMGMRPERCCSGPTIVAPARHILVRTLHCTGYDARARPGPAGGRGRGSGLRMGGRAAGDCRMQMDAWPD